MIKSASGHLIPDLNTDNKYYYKYIIVWRSHRAIKANVFIQHDPHKRGSYPQWTTPGNLPDNSTSVFLV